MDELSQSEIKASAILYVTSAIAILFGILTPLMDMANRSVNQGAGSFVGLLEWNGFSQVGLVLILLSLFLFWLGLLVDRRGA